MAHNASLKQVSELRMFRNSTQQMRTKGFADTHELYVSGFLLTRRPSPNGYPNVAPGDSRR